MGDILENILWGMLAIRMLIPFQVHFGIERVLKLSAGLSYTGALREGVISAGITGQNQYAMSRMGFFLHMPVLYIMVFLSICVSIYLFFRYHERYGFAINRLRVSLQDTGKQVEGMEAYESIHYRKRDLRYKRLILFVNDVFWFNPFMYLMRRIAYEEPMKYQKVQYGKQCG